MKRIVHISLAAIGGLAVQIGQPAIAESPTMQHETAANANARELASYVRGIAQSDGEAAYAVFFTRLADKVDLRHVPATATEGVVDGSYISRGARMEDETAHRTIKNFRVELTDIAAHGDEVGVLRAWRGIAIDGLPMEVKTRVKFKLRDKEIIAITAAREGDAKDHERMMATLTSQGPLHIGKPVQ